jgi:two-component sensor histidine kinase
MPFQAEICASAAGPRLRVLQLEDSDSDAALTVRLLTKAGYEVTAHRVEDAEGFRAALLDQTWDVILADYNLPRFDAHSALSITLEGNFDIPFIVVSGEIGEDVAVAMMKSGAHDYLMKAKPARLAPAVEREIREAGIRCERRQQEQTRSFMARQMEAHYEAQQRTLRELESAIAQKTILLKEIHHRVKNNLAVVSGLLGMRADATEFSEVKVALEDSLHQVRSMALVHQILYATSEVDRIDFGCCAEQMVYELESEFAPAGGSISVRVGAEPIELDIEQAVPCALILNELVTNAFKHAFPNQRHGNLEILFRVDEGKGCLQLSVEDDGIGCPATLPDSNGNSLGMKLVDMLARQLSGRVAREQSLGSLFVLQFPAQTLAASAAAI